jgi:Tfp pilus assembly protein PilN
MEGSMKSALNLLPPTARRARMLRRRALQWAVVLCVVLTGAWAARWWKCREFESLNQRMEAVEREGRPAQVKLKEINAMREQLHQLQQHEDVAQELQQQRQVLAVLVAVSTAAQQSGGRLRVTDFEISDFQAVRTDTGSTKGASGPTAKDTTHGGSVTVVGVSLDSPAVAEFHDILEKSGLFVDVKLIKSSARKENQSLLYDYEVCCEL